MRFVPPWRGFSLKLRSHSFVFLDQMLRLLAHEKPKGVREEKGDRAIAQFDAEYGFFSHTNPLVGRVSQSHKDTDVVCQLLDKLASPFAAREVFVKALSFRNLRVGMEIPYLGDLLQVDAMLPLWGGIPAFGFVSKSQNYSLLLFRGTYFRWSSWEGLASIISDLDRSSPGYTLYTRAKPLLRSWLQRVPAPQAMGYSLGGVLATYTTLDNRDLLREAPAIAFHPPGIYRKIRDKWQMESAEQKERILSYVVQNDLVSQVGKVIGKKTLLSPCTALPPIDAHTRLVSGMPHFVNS